MANIESLSQEQLDRLLAKYQSQNPKQNDRAENQNVTLPSQQSSRAGAFGQGALDSATLGFAPKIIAGVGAPILQFLRPDLYGDQSYSDVYKDFRDFGRGEMNEAANQQPLAYGAGSLAGALPLPFPATTVKGAAGLGALYGAAQGLGSSDSGQAFEINQGNVQDALSGGALGGVLGGASQKLFNTILPKKVGNEEVLDRLALSEQFGVPLTKGEALQDQKLFLKEDSALRGNLGDKNALKIRGFNEQRTKEYKKSAEELVKKFSGGKEFTEKGANIGESVNKLVDQALEERAQYSQLYKEAKENVGSVSSKDFDEFIKNATQDLESNFITSDNAPAVFNELKALETRIKGSKTLDLKSLEAWRQGLNRSYKGALRSGEEQSAFALNEVKSKFDGFLDGVIDTAIQNNDTKTLDQLKNARTLASEWFGKYNAKNPQEYGKRFVQDIIDNRRKSDNAYTNEQIVNKIFGSSELGFKPESAAIVKEIKKLMPEAEFNNIKLEAGQKLITPLLKDTPNVTTYNNNLKKFIQNNPTLTKELFSKSELKDLQDLGKLGKTIFTREKSLVNPSGTSNVLIDYLSNNKYVGFVKKLFDKVELDQGKIKAAAFTKEGREIPGVVKASQLALTNKNNGNEKPKESKPVEDNSQQGAASVAETSKKLSDLSDSEFDEVLQRAQKSKNNNTNSLLNKISKVESGNNPNAKNPNSSASGLFQLTDDTWKSLRKKYNIRGNKNDPEVQKKAASLLLNENKATLTKALDRKPTDGELYIAHFLGAKDAAKLIEAKNSDLPAARLFPKAAKANRSIFFANGRPLSTNKVYKKLSNLV